MHSRLNIERIEEDEYVRGGHASLWFIGRYDITGNGTRRWPCRERLGTVNP